MVYQTVIKLVLNGAIFGLISGVDFGLINGESSGRCSGKTTGESSGKKASKYTIVVLSLLSCLVYYYPYAKFLNTSVIKEIYMIREQYNKNLSRLLYVGVRMRAANKVAKLLTDAQNREKMEAEKKRIEQEKVRVNNELRQELKKYGFKVPIEV